MARGQPDFGKYAPKTVGATLADMGELAARLGSINTYDRRGDVIDWDDFEGLVIRGYVTPSDTQKVELDSTHVRSGSQALKITTDTYQGSNPQISKRLSSQGSLRQGIEIHFSNPSNTAHLEFYMAFYDGTNIVYGEIDVDFVNGILKVWDKTAGWVTLASGLSFTSQADLYYPIKLVVDFSAEKYVRALLMDTEYDLSAYTLSKTASAVAPMTRSYIVLELDTAGSSAYIWLDDFIFTINEP